MDDLIKIINKLKKSEVLNIINARIKEFAAFKEESIQIIFREMCFCIMTANCGAEKCIEIHNRMKDDFLILDRIQLAEKFKECGYRFPNIRSGYIIEARDYITDLEKILNQNNQDGSLRDWIVKNIKGLGYKEASHFLRNVGYENYAIIDFHIIDVLVKYKLIEKPKTLTKKKYIEIEYILKEMGEKLKLSLAELDLYLWYLETGKVLK
ncbi:MAG: N-glycosylase/DNA lyase [Candidatus Lokiarchaeota archaeon]|nr:N-glycosylase/DNA lyase [Candidatus Lokiarchaeota archaeon]